MLFCYFILPLATMSHTPLVTVDLTGDHVLTTTGLVTTIIPGLSMAVGDALVHTELCFTEKQSRCN